jgi:hypothetical protein
MILRASSGLSLSRDRRPFRALPTLRNGHDWNSILQPEIEHHLDWQFMSGFHEYAPKILAMHKTATPDCPD